MAIIYSYPTVIPTANDLVLGTDVDQAGKPTKNFTIQSIVDIVAQGGVGLAATLTLGNDAGNQAAIGFTNLIGTGTVTFGGFADGNMTITNGVGTGFTSITSTDFVGNITGIVKAGSSIVGTVTGVTQNAGDNSTKLATTAYVDGKVDPSILTFAGTSGGNQTVNLAAQTFSLLGTANQIESVSTAQTITFRFPAAGVVLPDGSTATTQAATDDSTKVATTAFVRDYDDLQDLDFSGTTGTGAVVLNSQTLAIAGTANQVVTSAAGQTLTIALTNPVVRDLTGNVTGILKDGSSIETTVTGVTQAAGNDSTRLATTAYVDTASGAKTLDYAGDATGPFALNLSTDDLEFNGDTNITVTAAAVAANKGIVTIDLNNDVGISGTMTAGTFTDGTFTGSAGTYTGYASITSTAFVGALTGNATTATALATPGTIQLLSGSGATLGVASNAVTYTSGGNVQLTTTLADTTVTGKALTNLPTPTSSAIAATDTINQALAKLQGQITAAGGGGALAYEGAWRASVTAVANGAVSSSTALVIATADANLVKGTVVEGTGITGTVRIDSITGTAVTLDTAITIANGITLTMSPPGGAITGATAGTAASLTTPANKLSGRFYICDTVGKAEPNAAVPWAAATTPNEWAVGDWVVYISNGSQPDQWQKLDQSNEIFGSGAANKIAKWTASNTLGTGLIEDDGTTVTIGANGNLTVLGDTILGDNAAVDTITLNGPTTFESTGRFKKGLALGTATDGSEYGATGQVLTASTASGSPPTWTTPTVGVVTSITGDYGITVAGTAAVPTIAVTADVNNLINQATAKATPEGADTILINDSSHASGGVLKKATLTSIKTFTAESWILSDGTNTTTISDGDTAKFEAAGTGIAVGENNGTVTITGSENPGTGTALTLPVWEAGGATLGDSMVSQNAATGTTLTISGLQPSVVIDDTTTGKGSLTISRAADVTTYMSAGITTPNTDITYGTHVFSQTDGTTPREILKLDEERRARFYGRVGINKTPNQTDVPLVIDTMGTNNVALSVSSLDSSDANEDCKIIINSKGTGIAAISTNSSIDLQKQGTSMALISTTGISVTGSVTATKSGTAGIFNSGTTNVVASFTSTDGTGVIQLVDSSGNVEIGASGDNFIVQPAGGTTQLTVGASSSTFAGNVEIDGNLTVDGVIKHGPGGSGSGTAKGGIFSKLYTTGVVGASGIAFTITRNSDAAMVFDVMFTGGGTGSGSSTCKKYTVAKKYGTAIGSIYYNKIIDTGPALGGSGTADYDILFDVSGSSGDAIECNITAVGVATQQIGITINLGLGNSSAVVVMN